MPKLAATGTVPPINSVSVQAYCSSDYGTDTNWLHWAAVESSARGHGYVRQAILWGLLWVVYVTVQASILTTG
jgi:hypothetical protein